MGKKPDYNTSGDEYEDDYDGDEYCCSNCGQTISEWEFREYSGLCQICRGLPLHQGFPGPPGFPGM